MRRELIVKSKSLAGTSDLTLLAKIKPGLVASLDTVSHKSRIKRLLQTLGAGRGNSQEYALLRPFSDAVERVGKIHSVRVAVLEPENKVLLAVTFDGSWEAYIRVLWQKVGTLLDIIFFDTENYVSAYDNRFEEWEAWCRRVQVETHFYYGTPGLTVDDVRYLRHEERCHRERPGAAADLVATRYAVQSAEAQSWQAAAKSSGQTSLEALKQGLEALAALYRLADLYLPSSEDGLYLQRAARDLLLEFVALLEHDEFAPSLIAGARQRFDKQLTWLLRKPRAAKNPLRDSPPLPSAVPEFDATDVQGGIVRAYERTSRGCLMLWAIDDRGQAVAFFRKLVDEVTREDTTLLAGDVIVNASLTYEGLRACGLGEDELAMFPEEFRQGMESRASTLGDLRGNHPRRWKLPVKYGDESSEPERIELAAVHVVVQLRWRDREDGGVGQPSVAAVDNEVQRRGTAGATRGMRLLAVQAMQRRFNSAGSIVEHFGFADGQSDPSIDPGKAGTVYRNQIHLGELLLGYANEADHPPDPERAANPVRARQQQEWLRNGSFLVVRKLAQDRAALDAVLAGAKSRALPAKLIAAKMMGRNQDGTPLADPQAASLNDFDYGSDPGGRLCPFHSHIRRANPRAVDDVNAFPGKRVPRIARRGMSYGPGFDADPSKPRGTVFMAYNASIAEQFEVVQRWVSGGNGSGGYSGQSDPFLGVPPIGERRTFRFENKGRVVSVPLDGSGRALGETQPFVRLEWGAYLFTPSLTTLRRLRDVIAEGGRGADVPWSIGDGEKSIAELREVERTQDERTAIDAWKVALEDSVEVEKFRAASIWAAIRARHAGVVQTPYGVLVADRATAMQVLHDGKTYSVSGYRDRLATSIGEIYLGQDDGEEYQRQCRPVNAAIHAISRQDAFDLALEATRNVLGRFIQEASEKLVNPADPVRWELILEIREVIDRVLGAICQTWFGLPEKTEDIILEGARWDAESHRALFPGHFTAPSRYVFQPQPGESAQRYGREYGHAITSGFTRFLLAATQSDWPPPGARIAEAIWDAFRREDISVVARTLVGAMMGFLPTVDGNLRRSLNEWLYEGTFWSLRNAWRSLPVAERTLKKAEKLLAPPLYRAMQLRPSPELVWRTATCDSTLGAVAVKKGVIVVVSIVSAAHECLANGDPDHFLLFGGDRSQRAHPTHACPAYEAAAGVMLGFIAALLEVDTSMRPSAVPLALTFEGPLGAKKRGPPSKEETDEAAKAEVARQRLMREHRVKLRCLVREQRPKAERDLPAPAGRQAADADARPWIIGLGDSWFHYFAIDIFDVFNERCGFDAESLACEGVGLLDIVRDPTQLLRLAQVIDDGLKRGRRPAAILLSAGGNDVVNEKLAALLERKANAPGLVESKLCAYVDRKMARALSRIADWIEAICAQAGCSGTPVVVHGYDFPNPDGRGPFGNPVEAWLLPAFRSVMGRNNVDPTAARKVMHDLIVRLNAMQIKVVGSRPKRLFHASLTGTLTADSALDWGNELHPTEPGFVAVAKALAVYVNRAIKEAGEAAKAGTREKAKPVAGVKAKAKDATLAALSDAEVVTPE